MNKYLLLIFFMLLITYKKYKIFIKLSLLQYFIIQRGLITVNCFWYNLSDLILDDASGINLYYKLKEKNKDFTKIYLLNNKMYAVTNYKFIKYIIENSPYLFSPGKAKIRFFNTFMKKNVGISKGKKWESRRLLNDKVLITDKLHIYAEKFNNDIKNYMKLWKNKNTFDFNDLSKFGKYMVSKVIFNKNKIEEEIFDMFKKSNNFSVFIKNTDFLINEKKKYYKYLKKHIDNPEKKSLIELCLKFSKDKEEILYQIPHFIFPIFGLFAATIPRCLLMLINNPKVLNELIKQINNIDSNAKNISKIIYKFKLLRYCVLETLRLNNPVITMIRTLEKDISFKIDNNKTYQFKKGEQFLILTNPILRDKTKFDEPNKFNPNRFNKKIEKNIHFISFNHGNQRCPGKELAIYLCQSFIYNFIKFFNVKSASQLKSLKINIDNIPQIINPCKIKFSLNE